MKASIAVCAAALLAACALEPAAERAAPRSSAYEEGWRAGCASGLYVRSLRFSRTPLAGDNLVIDPDRFRKDNDYALGWADGMRNCDTGRPGADRSERR